MLPPTRFTWSFILSLSRSCPVRPKFTALLLVMRNLMSFKLGSKPKKPGRPSSGAKFCFVPKKWKHSNCNCLILFLVRRRPRYNSVHLKKIAWKLDENDNPHITRLFCNGLVFYERYRHLVDLLFRFYHFFPCKLAKNYNKITSEKSKGLYKFYFIQMIIALRYQIFFVFFSKNLSKPQVHFQ